MATINAKWINKDSQSLENISGDLRVKLVAAGDLERAVDGLRVVPGSFIRPDGTIPFNSDQSMGGFKLTNLGTPVADSDAATKGYIDGIVDNLATSVTEIEKIILTSTDITNKYVDLSYNAKSINDIDLHIQYGPPQVRGVDYQLLASDLDRVSWDGLGMDGIVESGDALTVTYNRDIYISSYSSATPLIHVYDTYYANDLVPDLDKVGREPYSLFDIYDSIKFYKDTDGGVWFFLNITEEYKHGIDINFELMIATLANDSNASHVAKFVADVYVTQDGDTEISGSPDYQYTDELTMGTNLASHLQKMETVDIKIPSTVVNSNNPMIAIRLWRDTSISNNYDADISLVSITPKQS